MPNIVTPSAEEYLAFHELDLQNSSDLTGTKVTEAVIPVEAVRNCRLALGLNMEMMAVLLGVNLSSMVRYENISLPPYPQGAVSRKVGILINWLGDAKSRRDIVGLLSKPNGIATLSGLLQTESVITFLCLSSIKEGEAEKTASFRDPAQVMGNA
ncbi:MAG: hypothetical protein LBF58_01945 [Deltaproteobacteria bacterium]|jgi:hypothetical protein|nr:hypothetical protein [Deltaproteobacteria bacterium]